MCAGNNIKITLLYLFYIMVKKWHCSCFGKGTKHTAPMKKALFVLLAFPFVAMQCKPKEGDECHYSIKVQNTSGKDIVLARNGSGLNNENVAVMVDNIADNSVYEYRSDDCWEFHLTSDSKEEIYLLEKESLPADTAISVDTLVKYNKLLRRVPFNNDELKNNYFVITYP